MVTIDCYINVYRTSLVGENPYYLCAHSSMEDAAKYSTKDNLIARIPFTMEFHEGDGLDEKPKKVRVKR